MTQVVHEVFHLNKPFTTVYEVQTLILESVNTWKNYDKSMPSRSSVGVTRQNKSSQHTSNVYSQLSGLVT
jgi:hypothetical protein